MQSLRSGSVRRHSRSLALLAAGVALPAIALPGVALAQDTITTSSPAVSSPRGGAAPAERSAVTLGVTSRYDSNVARTGDGLVLPAARITGNDIRVDPYVSIDVVRNLGRHQIGLASTLGYDFYVRNTSLNSERISVDPFVNLALPVCNFYLSASVRRRQSELGDLVFFNAASPATAIDNKETFRRAGAQATCGGASGLRPTFSIDVSSGNNSNFLRRFADFNTVSYRTGLSYAGPALGEITLFASRSDTDRPDQIGIGGQAGGYTSRGVGVGYRRDVGTWLFFDGSLSYTDLQTSNSPLGQSGLNGSASLSLVLGPRLQLVASANRQFTSSLSSNASYEIDESYGLTANYAVSSRLRVRAGGQISPRSYFYETTPVGPFISKQTQRDIFAGASYSLNRRLSLTFDTGYQTRRADLNAFDYDNFFAAVGLVFRLQGS